jgi:predicted metal-dependent hydrolase
MIRTRQTEQAERAADFIEVTHSGALYRIAIRRMRGARRFTLRVRAAARDVVLSMPLRAKLDDGRKFAEQHAAWIGARIKRLPEPVPFLNGAIVPFRGRDHTIIHEPAFRGGVWTETRLSGTFEHLVICSSGDSAHIDRRIHDFLKRHAKLDLTEAVNRHSTALGVKPLRVSLRDTSSRWGSCSASGNLNFSWRLILAPAFVLDYLAAHEVAHLKHLNHSSKFWDLTKQLCPATDSAEAWLKSHGSNLHRFGKAVDDRNQPS